MELIYRTTVTGVGKEAVQFLDQGMFVIFKDNAPDYLKEFCIIHNENNLLREIEVNDLLRIGDEKFKVVTVGSSVNENLEKLGHITFRFSGEEGSLPGSITLEKKDIPEMKENMKIEIWRQ